MRVASDKNYIKVRQENLLMVYKKDCVPSGVSHLSKTNISKLRGTIIWLDFRSKITGDLDESEDEQQ
jgi:hypothetical protein